MAALVDRDALVPAEPILRVGAREPFIVVLARDIAVVDDGAAEGRQRKARHDHIDADDDAEEGDQDHRRMASREGLALALVGHGSVPGRSNGMVSRSPRGSSTSARTALVKSCRAGPSPGATTNSFPLVPPSGARGRPKQHEGRAGGKQG